MKTPYPTRSDVAAYLQAQRQAPLALRASFYLRGLFARVPANQAALCIFNNGSLQH